MDSVLARFSSTMEFNPIPHRTSPSPLHERISNELRRRGYASFDAVLPHYTVANGVALRPQQDLSLLPPVARCYPSEKDPADNPHPPPTLRQRKVMHASVLEERRIPPGKVPVHYAQVSGRAHDQIPRREIVMGKDQWLRLFDGPYPGSFVRLLCLRPFFLESARVVPEVDQRSDDVRRGPRWYAVVILEPEGADHSSPQRPGRRAGLASHTLDHPSKLEGEAKGGEPAKTGPTFHEIRSVDSIEYALVSIILVHYSADMRCSDIHAMSQVNGKYHIS